MLVRSNADSSAIPVVAVTSQDGFVEGWCSYGIFSNLNLAQLESGSTNNTINEIGGTGKKIISVGAFCTKNTWYTLDSLPYHYGQQAVLGEIADFSAKGPTADGRIKPDIACPGYGVVSSFSRYFDGAYPPPYYRVQAVPFGNQSYCFGILQGTSEATPIVSGTIALWMQENPSLTTEEALHIIRSTAIPSPGMSSPNNYWGWGILNAGAGMKQVINALSYEVK